MFFDIVFFYFLVSITLQRIFTEECFVIPNKVKYQQQDLHRIVKSHTTHTCNPCQMFSLRFMLGVLLHKGILLHSCCRHENQPCDHQIKRKLWKKLNERKFVMYSKYFWSKIKRGIACWSFNSNFYWDAFGYFWGNLNFCILG